MHNPEELASLKRKAIHGVVSLTFRRVIILAINFGIINFFLLPYVSPAMIGTFNLANSIVSFFSYFSDIGLGASLIQKKDLQQEDVATTFVIQEILVTLLSIIIFIAAPFFAQHYQLDFGGTQLIQALAVSFFLISLKVIPSVLLERNLNFRPLVTVEIVETLVFNILLITLVFNGFGLLSFAFAQIVRAIVGTILLFNLSPWKISIRYSKVSAKVLLHFGVPFQLNSLLALLKDRLVPLVVAGMISKAELGFVTVAQSWAFIPLEVMNMIIRVTFPAYSRLQDNRELLAKAVERSMYVMGLILYPAIAGILALIPNLVMVVGAEKWGATIPLVYLFSFATFWASISTTYTNVFNAVGQIKLTFRLMIMWTALEWLLTPLLVWQIGYLGVAIASAIISFSSILTIVLMRQIAPINLFGSISKPIMASILMGLVLYPTAKIFLASKLMLIPLILIGGLFYSLIMLVWDRKKIFGEAKEIISAIR